MTSGQIKLYLFLSLCPFFTISDYQCMMVKNISVSEKPHGQGEYMGLKFKFKHLNFHRFHQAMQPKPINYTILFYLLNPFLSPESYIKKHSYIFFLNRWLDDESEFDSLSWLSLV